MPGVTTDIPLWPYGVTQPPIAQGVGANQTVYPGCVALQSGSGATTTGYLKNAASPGNADVVVGMVGQAAGGTYVQTGPGIVGGTTDGSVWVDALGGAFMIQSGTGADLLSAATNGMTVYYGGENVAGPIACATSGSGTRPKMGTQLPQDPSFANYSQPGSNYWPISLNQVMPGGPL